MKQPHLCMIHEGIGTHSAIAKVALWGVKQALGAGWRVTVVANRLDPEIRAEVDWLPLYVPPRAFLLKWLTARHFIRRALGNRKFNVIHAHQPQVASLSNIFTCHFLTRVAHEHHALESGTHLRSKISYAQQRAALLAEDYYYSHFNPATKLVFCSELLQHHFNRLYPRPPLQEVLVNACPELSPPSPETRQIARRQFTGEHWSGLVVGYLGGIHERKGYRHLIHSLQGHRNIFLLLAGEFTDRYTVPELPGHHRCVGWVHDLKAFLAACDVLLVPSAFDPCPLSVLDAVAAGVPVIATEGVGNLPELQRYGAGACWTVTEPLAPHIHHILANRKEYEAGALRMAVELSESRQAKRLLELYHEALDQPTAALTYQGL